MKFTLISSALFHSSLFYSRIFIPFKKANIVLLLSGRFAELSTALLHTATGNDGYLKCCFCFYLEIKLFDHILVAQMFLKSVAEIFFLSS